MTAQAAGQDLTKPDMVELHGIHATMEMQDKSSSKRRRKTGHLQHQGRELTLSQNIVVTSSNGYQALLSEAMVDIRAGKIVSDKPVEVKTRHMDHQRQPDGDRRSPAISCVSSAA